MRGFLLHPNIIMKFKEDEWLTEYVNATHFTLRQIEKISFNRKDFSEDKEAFQELMEICKSEADALIQEAVLCNIPMQVFNIRRITKRLGADGDGQTPYQLKTYKGDVADLIADYRFICEGFDEFTTADMIEACSPYLEKIYPDIEDMEATLIELLNKEIERGEIQEMRPGVFSVSADRKLFP